MLVTFLSFWRKAPRSKQGLNRQLYKVINILSISVLKQSRFFWQLLVFGLFVELWIKKRFTNSEWNVKR